MYTSLQEATHGDTNVCNFSMLSFHRDNLSQGRISKVPTESGKVYKKCGVIFHAGRIYKIFLVCWYEKNSRLDILYAFRCIYSDTSIQLFIFFLSVNIIVPVIDLGMSFGRVKLYSGNLCSKFKVIELCFQKWRRNSLAIWQVVPQNINIIDRTIVKYCN